MFEVQLEKLQVEFKESLRESYEPLQAQIDGLVARVEQVRCDTDGGEGEGRWMNWVRRVISSGAD
jgi:hypothetical protein